VWNCGYEWRALIEGENSNVTVWNAQREEFGFQVEGGIHRMEDGQFKARDVTIWYRQEHVEGFRQGPRLLEDLFRANQPELYAKLMHLRGEGPHNGNVRGNRTWWFEHITISNWHLHKETNNGSEMTNCGVRFGFMEGLGKNRMGLVMSTDVQVDMTSIVSDRRFTGPNSMAIGMQLFSSHFAFMAKLCNTFSGCNQ
jgi:hypothetical protein